MSGATPVRTPADDAEEARRATPAAYLEFADSYLAAARTLQSAGVDSPHAQAPIRLLQYHAIELLLKAHLRAHDYAAAQLCEHPFGHRIDRIIEEARGLGLLLSSDDLIVLEQAAQTETLARSRYFRTGPGKWPDRDALDHVCSRLRQQIAGAISGAK